jgi:hypothetical protein
MRHKDNIEAYNSIIETPVTQRYARTRIQSGLNKSKRELAKTQAEFDKFKKYKTRIAISR